PELHRGPSVWECLRRRPLGGAGGGVRTTGAGDREGLVHASRVPSGDGLRGRVGSAETSARAAAFPGRPGDEGGARTTVGDRGDPGVRGGRGRPAPSPSRDGRAHPGFVAAAWGS